MLISRSAGSIKSFFAEFDCRKFLQMHPYGQVIIEVFGKYLCYQLKFFKPFILKIATNIPYKITDYLLFDKTAE